MYDPLGHFVYFESHGGFSDESGRKRNAAQATSSGSTVVREDGAVGWMNAVDLSEEHESGNTGDTTIDLIWITLK